MEEEKKLETKPQTEANEAENAQIAREIEAPVITPEQEGTLERDMIESQVETEGVQGEEQVGVKSAQSKVSPYVQDQYEARKKEVEKVLAEGLEEIYAELAPDLKLIFKSEGEKAASEISVMLSDTKVKIKKIVELIRNWLSIIPGVNKYFLEQEAKIKTDDIMDLRYKND